MLKSLFSAFFSPTDQRPRAELDAYRHGVAYLDDLDRAIHDRILSRPLPPGAAPWARPGSQHHALLFASIARSLATIAGVLLDNDARGDPATAGSLPLVTFEQARELYAQVPIYLTKAWEALANPRYVADVTLPVALGPRAEAGGKCPVIHMHGIHAAARALDAIGQQRINEFFGLVKSAGAAPPDAMKDVIATLSQLWARAQSRVAFSSQQLAIVTTAGHVPVATHEQAEDRLWEALSDHFLLGQLIAMPELLVDAGPFAMGRTVTAADAWFMTDPAAVASLRGTRFGETEIRVFWDEKRWQTTPREERYLAQCARLLREGKIRSSTRWSTCPFDPGYLTLEPVTVLGRQIAKGHEFHLHMDDNADELQVGTPLFRRAAGYEEEHEGGH